MRELPEGWVETIIRELVTNKILCKPLDGNHGGIHPKGDDFVSEGVPFVMASDLKDGKVDLQKCCFITKKQADSLRKGFAKNGDVLLSHKATIGRTALLKTNLDYVILTPQVTYYRVNDKTKISNIFLKYYFDSTTFQNTLLSYAGGGSTRLYIGITSQLDLPITLPPLPEQKAIADMLSSFDDKIELLREQNKTLETLAQTMFKEWFVHFNFPDPHGKPYRNNGGAMVESELGEIPQGWQVKTIGELVELIIDYRGKTPKKLGMDWSDSGIPALSAKIIKNGKIVRRDAMNFGSKELYDIWMKDELVRKDILLTSEAPLGEMYYLTDDTKYILSQRLFALRVNKEMTSEYLYHYLFSPFGQYLLKSRASGSTVEGIRQSELRKVEVVVPEQEVLNKASAIFASVFEKAALNDKQIQTLSKTRDALLPKLMSGQVRVQGVHDDS